MRQHSCRECISRRVDLAAALVARVESSILSSRSAFHLVWLCLMVLCAARSNPACNASVLPDARSFILRRPASASVILARARPSSARPRLPCEDLGQGTEPSHQAMPYSDWQLAQLPHTLCEPLRRIPRIRDSRCGLSRIRPNPRGGTNIAAGASRDLRSPYTGSSRPSGADARDTPRIRTAHRRPGPGVSA